MKPDEKFLFSLIDNLYDGVYFVDTKRKITFWNKAAERITGFNRQEMIDSFCYQEKLRHIDDKGHKLCQNTCPLLTSIKTGNPLNQDNVYLHHKKGHRVPIHIRVTPIFDEQNKIIGAVEIFNETSAKLEVEKRINELEKRVNLDGLTRLPNRQYMENRLEASIYEFNKTGTQFGVLFMDIDDFKAINDRFGHNIGDKVLITLANTLIINIRPVDLICRWGGEEFVGYLHDINESNLQQIAEKLLILAQYSESVVNQITLSATLSIGATLIKKNDTLESLIKRADKLMYKSKRTGKNKVTIG